MEHRKQNNLTQRKEYFTSQVLPEATKQVTDFIPNTITILFIIIIILFKSILNNDCHFLV